MKVNLLILLFVVFSCERSFAYENIVIETKSDNLFENIVSDTLLLLDHDLKKIIEDDFAHIVANSKFSVPVNSWKPRLNPKNKLTTIYDRINGNNIRESFASLIQPIVELACTPQNSDPLNEYQSKCIKELFRYRIMETVKIGYTYRPNTTIEQNIANLTSLSSRFRYHQIVCSLADIMNKSYEQVSKKNIIKNVNFVKYPQPLIESFNKIPKGGSYNKNSNQYKNEEIDLESKINRLRINCKGGLSAQTKTCDNKIAKLRGYLVELDSNPIQYFSLKPAREQAEAQEQEAARARAQEAAKARAQAEAEAPTNTGAINPFTGEFLAPAGAGYVGTRDGTYYAPAGPNGIVNTRTGAFSTLTR